MTNALRQFTLRRLRDPVDKKLDEDIEWICNSLLKTVEEIERDILRTLVDIKRIASMTKWVWSIGKTN
jgi:hypothetical protein